MKKIILYILTLAAFFVFLNERLFAQETRNFDFKDFTGVQVGWGMHVNITQSGSYSIEVKADNEDLEVLKVEKDGDAVSFYIDRDNYRSRGKIYVDIKMPLLTDLDLSGGSKGKITMDIASKNFISDLSGGSILEGKLKCANIHLDLSGGSTVKLTGTGKNLNLEGSGGSIFKLKDFSVNDVNADLSGGSSVKITMNGRLDSDQSGGSRIVYYGKASIGNTDFSSGSGISKGD